MKKKVLASAIVVILSMTNYASANVSTDLASKIESLKTEYTEAELLAALNLKPTVTENSERRLHGTLGTNLEIEEVRRDDGVKEGKLKYTLAQGNFRHDDLPGWDFGFYSAREELFSGNLMRANYNRGVNSIQEVYTNKRFGFDSGSFGFGAKLAGESADKRTTPELKMFGDYRLSDSIDIHGYALYHIEFKRENGEFHYWEVEPGLGFKFSDKSGGWLNLRYQSGEMKFKEWKNITNEEETEWIIKPGIYYNWDNLSASLWGEFGEFNKENSYGTKLWKENYSKVGISANYPLSQNWRIFGETSYKDIRFTNYSNNTKFDGYIPVAIIGVNYSF